MSPEIPLLPTDAALLRHLREQPILVGSRSVTARQRRIFLEQGWMLQGRASVYGFQPLCYSITERGRARLASYESLTLEDTFK